MRYEVSQEPKDVEPGDIAVMRLVTTKGAVKWTCGTVRCFTDDDEDPAIVLTTGKIPEYDGYELVCRIRPIPDVVQMTLNDDGEVMAWPQGKRFCWFRCARCCLWWRFRGGCGLSLLASRWRLPPSYGSKPRKGPIVRGIRTVLAAPFAVLAFALVTVAMFSARAAMWISAGYRGAVKAEAEL